MSEEGITVKLPRESLEERARMRAVIQGGPHAELEAARVVRPLPIWFFAGLVLLVFGLVLVVAGLIMPSRPAALAGLAPWLLAGTASTCGVVLVLMGLMGRSKP